MGSVTSIRLISPMYSHSGRLLRRGRDQSENSHRRGRVGRAGRSPRTRPPRPRCGRGGGRIPRGRTPGDTTVGSARVDDGAQFFTVRGAPFAAVIDAAKSDGAVHTRSVHSGSSLWSRGGVCRWRLRWAENRRRVQLGNGRGSRAGSELTMALLDDSGVIPLANGGFAGSPCTTCGHRTRFSP
jgi:hypothetical protein